MNRPPDNPYSNNIRHSNRVSDRQYSSPNKPGSHLHAPQRLSSPLNRDENRSNKRRASRETAHPKKEKESLERARNHGEMIWEDLIEQPVKHRKLHRRIVDLITITVVLVLIGAGAASFLNFFSSDSPTNQVVPIVNVVVPTETLATPIKGTVGKLAQAGDWAVTITRVKTIKAPATTGTDQIYIEISLKLKNTSSSPQILVSLLEFLLSDNTNTQQHEVLTDPDIRQPPDGNIAAGQTIQAQIAFVIPKTIHSCVLNFQYGLVDHSTAAIHWQMKW